MLRDASFEWQAEIKKDTHTYITKEANQYQAYVAR